MYLMKQVGEVMLSRSLDEMPFFFYKHEDHQRFIAGRQMLLGGVQ